MLPEEPRFPIITIFFWVPPLGIPKGGISSFLLQDLGQVSGTGEQWMSSHYCVVQHHFPGGSLVPRAIFQQCNWGSQQSGTRTSPGCATRTRYPMYLVLHCSTL